MTTQPEPMSVLQLGLALGLASILSVGPNNLMMLRAAIGRTRPVTVAATVWASYNALAAVGIVLGAEINEQSAWLTKVLPWLGVVALLYFATSSLRKALSRAVTDERPAESTHIASSLRTIWLNPLTYLERLVMPSVVAADLDDPVLRLLLFFGLAGASTMNCFSYTLGGRLLARVIRSPRGLRIFDCAAGLLLICLASAGALTLLARN
ncbi:L-lysine exporter family protein LysE/ArgO [Mesorhizobium soli]|jgi:L-lysine exporter family protein LysE/ArgO|uniref:LysE family transporter n=1 Tax=Pseudaminobacter soli (ex Li et al. 2025) TaxID=1295366 RepID=UPI002472E8AC|nr:LysE family transporter [Mesorhizobium soli]MDH6231019.1 L-lysine exporter family protein LysE/ArgO [Mesorhizobium soli]